MKILSLTNLLIQAYLLNIYITFHRKRRQVFKAIQSNINFSFLAFFLISNFFFFPKYLYGALFSFKDEQKHLIRPLVSY